MQVNVTSESPFRWMSVLLMVVFLATSLQALVVFVSCLTDKNSDSLLNNPNQVYSMTTIDRKEKSKSTMTLFWPSLDEISYKSNHTVCLLVHILIDLEFGLIVSINNFFILSNIQTTNYVNYF